MREVRAAALGFLCAAVVAAVIFTIVYPVTPQPTLKTLLGTFMVYGFAFAIAVLFLGLPAFLVLRLFGRGAWWIAAIAGAVLGLVVALALGGLREAHLFPVCATIGALSASAFWLIWSRSLERPAP